MYMRHESVASSSLNKSCMRVSRITFRLLACLLAPRICERALKMWVCLLVWYCMGAALWSTTRNRARARWDWYCRGSASVELSPEWNMTAAEIGMEWFAGERARVFKKKPRWINPVRFGCIFLFFIKRCEKSALEVVLSVRRTRKYAPAVFVLAPIDCAAGHKRAAAAKSWTEQIDANLLSVRSELQTLALGAAGHILAERAWF